MVQTNATPQDASGFDLYPERRENSKTNLQKALGFMWSNPRVEKIRCEVAVQKCMDTSPLVKTMMYALRAAGCDIDPKRHISCEPCHPDVTGGFDAEMNQIIICQNGSHSRGVIQSNLAHEMIHMFDFCRAKFDFKNAEHVACSEVRAANILHCSFMTAMLQGETSPFDFGATHKNCVRTKAVKSVMASSSLTKEQAEEAVDKVFPFCYNDLEPIGRRIRRKSEDMERSYRERYSFALS
ncbi:mitochondrial inner membrane protease ATP23 homolog [Galendromus occidentalis]|uniref:Mitochondrial inner membrane protease ATP23 n=1 Tax=Galendromus occidentalis TaxID=34638 RepID=A0AAJ6QYI7_9ACAR|nr:mitochondrial inner membrane protease ATP23 homolog [Galendromus occidentalis]